MRTRKKGQGNAMGSIISIIIMLSLVLIAILMISSHTKSKIELNLDETQMLRLKNSFSLLDRSLTETWLVSTAQAVFKTGDQSIGCGLDDLDENKREFMDAGYWYEYMDTKEPKQSASQQARLFLSNPGTEKYNKAAGTVGLRICYPSDDEAKSYMTKILLRYMDIQKKFDSAGINFEITKGPSLASLEILDTSVTSTVIQETKALSESVDATIVSTSTKITSIETKFKQMAAAARDIVGTALFISDTVENNRANNEFKYMPIDIGIETATDYNKRAEKQIADWFGYAVPSGLWIFHESKTQLRAGDSGEMNFQAEKQGLIYSYDMKITISEGSYTYKTGCDTSQFASIIGTYASEWKFTDTDTALSIPPLITTEFVYSKEETAALIAAVIQQESSCVANAKSCAGAAGLMQLMPDTARGLGLNVPSYGTETISCCPGDTTTHTDNLCNKCTPSTCTESEDDRFDPDKNIMGGTAYLKSLMEQFSENTRDKYELIKLALAAYNGGPGRVSSAISNTAGIDKDNVRFDDIKARLADETQGYVESVAAYYSGNGGFLSASGYYYHDEKNNIFSPRPFSLTLKVKDSLPVLDCLEELRNYDDPARFYTWKTPTDMACCGGSLWSCGAGIPNLGEHELFEGGAIDGRKDGSGEACKTAINNKYPQYDGDGNQVDIALVCRSGVFKLEPV